MSRNYRCHIIYIISSFFKIKYVHFSILDDLEMYEKQNPFKLTDFIVMSNFLNTFLYKAVMGNLFGKYKW